MKNKLQFICNTSINDKGHGTGGIVMDVKRHTDNKLALYIFTLINNSGKTYEQIAEALDVSPRVVNYYISGQRKPKQTMLLKLLRITNANLKEIPF